MPATITKRVLVPLPEPLLEQTDRKARELSTNRSELIRSALKTYLDGLTRERFEQELAECYRANSEFDLQISKEFEHVDAENF